MTKNVKITILVCVQLQASVCFMQNHYIQSLLKSTPKLTNPSKLVLRKPGCQSWSCCLGMHKQRSLLFDKQFEQNHCKLELGPVSARNYLSKPALVHSLQTRFILYGQKNQLEVPSYDDASTLLSTLDKLASLVRFTKKDNVDFGSKSNTARLAVLNSENKLIATLKLLRITRVEI